MKSKWENVWENVGVVMWILTPILGIGMFFFMIDVMVKDVETIQNEKQSYIGTKVLIGKDSLMIVDYSIIMGNYMLENGVKIDKSLVEE